MTKKIPIDFNKKITSLEKSQKIHFLGIGGIGVSGLAKCFVGLGFKVSGSDIKSNKNTDMLKEMGAEIFIGHGAGNLKDISLIVASSAIKSDNPEILEAHKLGIPIYHRSHALEAILSGMGCDEKPLSIGFSGTHGKTTTTGMCSLIFELAGENPTCVIGGILPQINTNAKFGNGKYVIAELDESDGTILLYNPDITVVTNLEVDHVDHYKAGFSQLLNTFKSFTQQLNSSSKLILNADDEGVLELYNEIEFKNILFYSMQNSSKAKFKAMNIKYEGLSASFDFYKYDEYLGEIKLNVPGEHNVSNALGVMASALEAGLSFEEIQRTITQFKGTGRRFEFIGEYNGAKIYDDYAHHPTEISATLKSAKKLSGRVVAVFQPHRYTRLQGLWEDFKKSFSDADFVIVTDVFSAGEDFIENFGSEDFAKEINATYVSGKIGEIDSTISELIMTEDVVITLGAGDVTQLGRKICSNR